MARGLEGHGVRRCALGVLSGLNEYSDAVISGDPGFGAAMSGHPRFHSGIPRRGIDDDSLPPHDVLAWLTTTFPVNVIVLVFYAQSD